MRKIILLFIMVAMSPSAFAESLTYYPDYSQMKDMNGTSLDICGFPTEFTIDSKDPIGPTFIGRMFWSVEKTERIQTAEGSVSGGNLAVAYSGDYREKVYIVKQVIEGVYEPGIFSRVEVTTYGSTKAPSGMIVNVELMNHRYSAELAEGAFCGNVYYKLAN